MAYGPIRLFAWDPSKNVLAVTSPLYVLQTATKNHIQSVHMLVNMSLWTFYIPQWQ
jgi:hypothetical protein